MPGTNTVTVRATDASGNTRTNTYEVASGGRSETYDYDANSNLLQRTTADGTWSYEWTAENQLARVRRDGVELARFTYDPIGRRATKSAGGTTTSWLYSAEDILRETNGSVTRTYVHGPGIDEPLAHEDAGAAMTYYTADALGSIVATTDAAGGVASTRQYDAWGLLQQGAQDSSYAFTGREWDPETNLYYYRARYYDPQVGRFISEDPVRFRGGVNFFAYVLNNPTNRLDPLGLDAGSGMQTLDFGNPPWAEIATIAVATAAVEVVASYGAAVWVEVRIAYAMAATGGAGAGAGANFCLGGSKSAERWAKQMAKRGWTMEMIEEALRAGNSVPATNLLNPGNPALRYIPPGTGQSVVIDTVTTEILHVGGPGFQY